MEDDRPMVAKSFEDLVSEASKAQLNDRTGEEIVEDDIANQLKEYL